MTTQTKVPLGLRALTLRINRALAPEGGRLKPSRGRHAHRDLGDFYVLDIRRNVVVEARIDLEALGRKLRVLAEWENLAKPARRRGRVHLDQEAAQ